MVHVLITRPPAASERLARELKHLGFECHIEPLLLIEPLASPLPHKKSASAVMITSANALKALALGDYEVSDLLGLPCFCVGPQTASEATLFGFNDVRVASGDGRELALLIQKELPSSEGTILYMAAQDIDSKAKDELEHRGYKIMLWSLYAARPVQQLSSALVERLHARKLDAVLIFSVRTAQVFNKLLKANALEACCESLSAIGLSEAVVDALIALPWRNVRAAEVPTEAAVIECLRRTCPVS